jgi:hypothetical protein
MLSPLEIFEQKVLESIDKEKEAKYTAEWERLKQEGYNLSHLYLKESPNKGMGVFANKDFEEGDIIEYAYCMIYDWRSKYLLDNSIKRFSYIDMCDCKECENHGGLLIQPFGYGSIYNSAETIEQRNANYFIINKKRLIVYEAITKINKGDEILLWFGESYFNNWCKNLNNKNKINPI